MCNWSPWVGGGVEGENIFEELMDENFPNLVKIIKPQIQKFSEPKHKKPEKITLRPNIIKLLITLIKRKS